MGKTVNSFRKHEVAGEMAKSLVAKWKKLVPQSADRYVCIPVPQLINSTKTWSGPC